MALDPRRREMVGSLGVPLPVPDVAPLPRLAPIIVPMALLGVLSGVILWFDLDLRVARWLFAGEGVWILGGHPVVQLLYHVGTWPAMVVTVLALGVSLTSPFFAGLRSSRRIAVFLVLVMGLGPGLVVNSLFKDNAGRARPREVREFGGDQPFRALGELHIGGSGKSFPSGHASMGFFWIALFVFWYRSRPRLAWWFLALGVVHGGLMGFGRVAQGAHWCSDVVWSAGFVYVVSWWVFYALPGRPRVTTRG